MQFPSIAEGGQRSRAKGRRQNLFAYRSLKRKTAEYADPNPSKDGNRPSSAPPTIHASNAVRLAERRNRRSALFDAERFMGALSRRKLLLHGDDALKRHLVIFGAHRLRVFELGAQFLNEVFHIANRKLFG